ncbi:NAD(P)H-dependent oxidoreductase [uncultured Aquimarina sp.]|uniref:NADPH-dependent FMN reductase n=1 Tax=uncultured Aquimarina sp. TaxID=575652 RepID=UPI00262038A2|nr:NAD(P)H-dependent oxidoreductase [uncultured Aquimarina sp.]
MKKILAFGASNSTTSINKTLATFAANQLRDVTVTVADLNDYASPLYSVDQEKESGVDKKAMDFYALINANDAIVISLAEYNGLHTSAFKNLWDWLSRIPMEKPMNIWGGKPMFLLSTSPSKRLESNVFKISKELFPHFGAMIVADFHLPSFNHFFKGGNIVEAEYKASFGTQKSKFQEYLDRL